MVNRTIANNLNLDGIPINTSGAYPIKSQRIILAERAPTVNDKSPQYNIGTIWVVLNRDNDSPDKYQYWYLADNALQQPGNIANATWLRFAAGDNFASQITTLLDGRVSLPANGNWNFQSLAPIEVRTPIDNGDTISFGLDGSVAEEYETDDGTAIPDAGVLNVLGGDNINTAAIPDESNNLYVNLNKSLHMPYSSADGTVGVWYTGASGFPLAGGQIFISNLGTSNTFVGEDAGNLTLSTGDAVENSGFGALALTNLTVGEGNTAAGYSSSLSLESGNFNLSAGHGSLSLLEDGDNNVALGVNSLASSVSDSELVAVGSGALQDADGVTGAVAIGFNSQNAISTGDNNTSVGHSSMAVATTAANNCVYGFEAGAALTDGTDNIIIGKSAADAITDASALIAIGTDALGSFTAASTTANAPIAIGYNALGSATANALGNASVAIGHLALSNADDISGANVAIGSNALLNLVPAGVDTGNVAIGSSAGRSLTGTSMGNICIGHRVKFNPVDAAGSFNTLIGDRVMGNNTGGVSTTGSNNTIIGSHGGSNFTGSEANNIIIGTAGNADIASAGDNNTLRIGAATGTGTGQINRSFIHGIRGITTGVADAINVLIDSAGQLGTVSSSIRYKDDVKDLESVQSADIYKLRPVSFVYKSDESKTVQYGLIAEEVEKVMPDMVVYDLEGQLETVKYNHLVFHMLKEIQNLRKELDSLKEKQ